MADDAKHTPGPWHWQAFRTIRHLFTAGGRCIKISMPMKGSRTYAPLAEEDEANARLIAAAPDLLAACEELLTVRTGNGLLDPASPAFARATAAVAKARGGA